MYHYLFINYSDYTSAIQDVKRNGMWARKWELCTFCSFSCKPRTALKKKSVLTKWKVKKKKKSWQTELAPCGESPEAPLSHWALPFAEFSPLVATVMTPTAASWCWFVLWVKEDCASAACQVCRIQGWATSSPSWDLGLLWERAINMRLALKTLWCGL